MSVDGISDLAEDMRWEKQFGRDSPRFRALTAAGKPVRYVEVKGMGHGPSTDEQTTRVYGEIESFLALHLAAPATK